jgi:hypothetical protein
VQEALQVRIAAQLQEVGLTVKVVEILITDSLSKGNNSRGSNTGRLVGAPVQKSFKNL